MRKLIIIPILLVSLSCNSQVKYPTADHKYIQLELNIAQDSTVGYQQSFFVELKDNDKLIREFKDNNNYLLPLEYNKVYKLTISTNVKNVNIFIFTDNCPFKNYIIPIYCNFNNIDTNTIYTMCYSPPNKQFKVYNLQSN